MAGHVDHGKTAIVRTLTGMEWARPEERRRGLTIDLGFANLDTVHGRIAVIDVPGHESFISNMVAGACGFDAALLVISARDGVQVQTIEHLRILQAFAVKHVAVVISKCDLVDDEVLDSLRAEIAEQLVVVNEQFAAPFFFVSAETSTGFAPLREWIELIQGTVSHEVSDPEVPFRMPIDRSFKKAGFGYVMTGTIWQGRVQKGDVLSLSPTGCSAVVRGVEVHHQPAEQAHHGQRVALNLSRNGVDPSRGMELVAPEAFKLTQKSGAWISPFSAKLPIHHNSELHLHTGTMKMPVRVILGQVKTSDPAPAVLRWDDPIIATANQRFILRSPDGRHTLAAGHFLCSNAVKTHKPRDVLQLIERVTRSGIRTALKQWLTFHGEIAQDIEDWQRNLGGGKGELLEAAEQLVHAGEAVRISNSTLVSCKRLELVQAKLIDSFSCSDNDKSLWIDEASLSHQMNRHASQHVVSFAIHQLVQTDVLLRHQANLKLKASVDHLSTNDAKLFKGILACYIGNRTGPTQSELVEQLQSPKKVVNSLLETAYADGKLVHIGKGFIYSPEVLQQLWTVYAEILKSEHDVSVATIRDSWKMTRKHAIPLLEYFDSLGLTLRNQGVRERGPKFCEQLII